MSENRFDAAAHARSMRDGGFWVDKSFDEFLQRTVAATPGKLALLADRATVLRRLNRRGFGFGLRHEHWAVSRLDDCLARLREPEFAEHIHTDQQTVPQVADEIARSAGLPIRPDTDGPLRGSLRRYATTLRHVRRD